MSRFRTAVLVIGIAMVPARGDAQRSPLNTFPLGDTAVTFRTIRAGGLRLPSSGVARITSAAEWRELWHRFNRWGPSTSTAVPPVDFSREIAIVVATRGGFQMAGDSSTARITARRDTMMIWPSRASTTGCMGSTSWTAVIVVPRTNMALTVSGVAQRGDAWRQWQEHRTLAEVQGMTDRAARLAWLEQLAVEDSSTAATARLVAVARELEGQSTLLALPWVQRDTALVRRLYVAGAQWSEEATQIMVAARGRTIVADRDASPADLAFMADYLIRCRDANPLLRAIYDHPRAAADVALRARIRDSGLLPP